DASAKMCGNQTSDNFYSLKPFLLIFCTGPADTLQQRRRHRMRTARLITALTLFLGVPCSLRSADNLVLNPHLDYSEHNKRQGLLITGQNMDDGFEKGKVNYVLFYFEKCYNAKRQARVTVNLYNKYKERVHFVIVDLDLLLTSAQMKLARKYCSGKIPHLTILNGKGGLIFDYTGEADEITMSGWIDYALRVSVPDEREALADGQGSPPGRAGSSSASTGQP